MEVKIIAGGSGGNVIAVRSNDTIIIIECGLPKTKIENLLIQNGFNPTDIQAIFITHPHQDHVQGIGLANKYRIPVYASEGTWKNEKYMQTVEEDLRNVATVADEINIENEFFITPFSTHHNDFDPFGFVVIGDKGNRLSICLDSGIVDQTMIEAMAGSNIFIIEANHDLDLLINGEYHEQLKARISSDLGHLSNEQTAEALAQLIVGKGERIILTHLSKQNNTPELAEKAVEDALEAKGFERVFDYQLEVIR
ncbi:MBL fold metallo-hydrolase [Paenibacillus psychroresistens]|uniref:MBL fold metallo-hydrolase n=1 Tax=Paenibacillus psychroresistens TaxID=1778678 RepID=A0A6B8RXY0_9BACL|nr:MBL fold metallo-hydrolase [Paenibacillus psychroresistens]QGR00174.1 MBL fold metallo-hydrolase [Paenibacillus psychroresistens]